jgi:hypothetical protein
VGHGWYESWMSLETELTTIARDVGPDLLAPLSQPTPSSSEMEVDAFEFRPKWTLITSHPRLEPPLRRWPPTQHLRPSASTGREEECLCAAGRVEEALSTPMSSSDGGGAGSVERSREDQW